MLYTMGKRKPFASFTPTAPQGRLVVIIYSWKSVRKAQDNVGKV